MPEFLTEDEVLRIHRRVCEDFADDDDPVGIAGPRENGALLQSVVARQQVGIGNVLKHPEPVANAATLTFGICCGHPFHNGNKRTALVTMLAHMDRNRLTLTGVRQRDLYAMIKSVAEHRLGVRPDPRKKTRDYTAREADEEVQAIASWLDKAARPLKRGEELITYKQLRRILASHGLLMANPKGNAIGIYREVEVRRGLMRNKICVEQKHVATIGYPGDNKIVGLSSIKRIRRVCQLDEPSGCDTSAFYEGADVIDTFVNEYRTILAKLARE
jgi:death-on-curing protein